ncbi:hypothetical protein SAMN04489727_3053 [Amycolatopsis tolypomycina]|uniref:Uncharacterized protein n=1 Tax=Amycolatopsis tolypomycina TaxID=208445 RepID=A0A1H4QVQ6_9PSEU|nr:hypothetical protein SAMN04489727_3053 [Amycolatopsis tolypomycina]
MPAPGVGSLELRVGEYRMTGLGRTSRLQRPLALDFSSSFLTLPSPTGAGKSVAAMAVIMDGFSRWSPVEDALTAFLHEYAIGSNERSCDCPACAEFTPRTDCADSPDRFGQRLSVADWSAAPLSSPAAHVVALMDLAALGIAAVLDEWTVDVSERSHRSGGDIVVHESSFHLVSPWILLLRRVLILAWRAGAGPASRIGLARVKRRSQELHRRGDVRKRPRCAGRAPRGPSPSRMSTSMVIRGGAMP